MHSSVVFCFPLNALFVCCLNAVQLLVEFYIPSPKIGQEKSKAIYSLTYRILKLAVRISLHLPVVDIALNVPSVIIVSA